MRPALAAAGAACLLGTPLTGSPVIDKLSISITDDQVQTRPNTSASYVTSLTNGGTAPVSGRVVVTAPAFAVCSAATGGATRTAHEAVFIVTVPALATIDERVTIAWNAIPRGQRGVAVLASFYDAAAGSRPVVQAADIDAVAAIAALAPVPGTQQRSDPATSASRQRRGGSPLGALAWILAAVATATGSAATVLGVLGRRRRRAPAETARHRK